MRKDARGGTGHVQKDCEKTEWVKMLANHVSNKGLVSRLYKELLQVNNKKINNPVKTYKTEIESQMQKTNLRLPRGKGKEG